MSDLKCPYCGAENEVNHDDGSGYDEDTRHQMTCGDCDKEFVFRTFVSLAYTPYRADCLNDADHELEFGRAWPVQFSKMRCTSCSFERLATEDEIRMQGAKDET